MKAVDIVEFWNTIGPLDVCVSVENAAKFPYTTVFKERYSGRIVGKLIDSYTDGIENHYPIVSQYYLERLN